MMRYILLSCIVILQACGGGGGSSDGTKLVPNKPDKVVEVPAEQRWDNVAWKDMKWR